MFPFLLLISLYGLTGESVKVNLIVPKTVPAGSSPTLICQYDLEGEPLYAVKWYRGHHEFYRYIPRAAPPMAAFEKAGINVDLLSSSANEVRLLNVPKRISGKVSCEVSVDNSFKTATDSRVLKIVDYDVKKPLLNVSTNIFNPNSDLNITCLAQETDPPPLINFYVDYVKIKRSLISDLGNGQAALKKEALYDFIRLTPGEYVSPIWVRCDAYLRGIYHRTSTSVAILPQIPNVKSGCCVLQYSWCLIFLILFLLW